MKFSAASRRVRGWLPALLLLLAMSTVYLFGDSWGRLQNYRHGHDWNSGKNLAIAENLSPAHNFLMFIRERPGPGGAPDYEPYNRFPIGSYALIKLVIAPFGDDLAAKLYAGQMLMLAMFAGSAVLAYLSLRRIIGSRRIAFAATLPAFSSYYLLYFNDMISNEITMDLFAVLLVFHGMTIFRQEGRFGQLLAKTCLALMIGWHVYALLLPFIVLGLGGETIRSLRGNTPGNGVVVRIRSAAAALIRSRYLRLGLTALLFGLAVLSFGLANEYAALGDGTPFRELPTIRSIEKRIGQNEDHNVFRAEFLAWAPFLTDQFRRIGLMVLPYAVAFHSDGLPYTLSAKPLSLPYAAVGMAAAGACLLGMLFLRRRRILLATLVLSGLCWGIGMRFSTALHNFEAVFYVGIPLVLFMLILVGLRRRWRWLPNVAAAAALPVFILSAYQMGQTEAQDQVLGVDTNAAAITDFQEMQGMTPGKRVYIQLYELAPYLQDVYHIIDYYLAGSVMHLGEKPIAGCGPLCSQYFDFVISNDRNLYPDNLLTPSNREVFLFDTGGIDTDGLTAGYRAVYNAVTSGGYGAPVARAEYDLFIADGKAIYYKSGCGAADTANTFFLHTMPYNRNDLTVERREYGFDNYDINFMYHGAVFDGNCIAIAPLPDYPIASIRTGQYVFGLGRDVWSVAIPLDRPLDYNAAVSAIAAGGYGEPAGRGVFDVYLGETEVVYYKEPCESDDTRAQFFLHFIPADDSDLPSERQRAGFDNRDFSFTESGALTGGRCVAIARLPDYPVDRIRTGQFVSGEGQRLWAVEFAGGGGRWGR